MLHLQISNRIKKHLVKIFLNPVSHLKPNNENIVDPPHILRQKWPIFYFCPERWDGSTMFSLFSFKYQTGLRKNSTSSFLIRFDFKNWLSTSCSILGLKIVYSGFYPDLSRSDRVIVNNCPNLWLALLILFLVMERWATG